MTAQLAQAQRRMQALITGGDGGPASGLVCETAALPAEERIALYRRTYALRLVGCLRESYPALRHALTPALFDDFALEYLAARPSRSYTLNALGAGWPEHLEATRPDRDEPEPWADLLVDLARLERTFCEVYDAPGGEGRALASVADLPAAPDAGTTASPLPCVRLLRARFAVGDYMLAVRRGEDPPLPAARESRLAVSRRDYVVTLTELDGAGFALLGELAGGASVGAAAGAAAVDPAAAWSLLRDWAAHGFFSAITTTRGVAR